MYVQRSCLQAVVLVLTVSVLIGCQKANIETDPLSPLPGISSILILPFKNISKIYGENASVRCPLSGSVFRTGPVPEDASQFLTERLIAIMVNKTRTRLILPDETQGIQSRMLSNAEKSDSEHKIFVDTGREIGADAILAGHIYRFEDRVGEDFSVESPASVAFDLHFIRMSDGKMIGSAYVDETQHSLNENLFQLKTFIKRKGRWITAREMAASGLEDLVNRIVKK